MMRPWHGKVKEEKKRETIKVQKLGKIALKY